MNHNLSETLSYFKKSKSNKQILHKARQIFKKLRINHTQRLIEFAYLTLMNSVLTVASTFAFITLETDCFIRCFPSLVAMQKGVPYSGFHLIKSHQFFQAHKSTKSKSL